MQADGSIFNDHLKWPASALFRERELPQLNLLKFYFKCIAVSQIQFRDNFDNDKQSKWIKSVPRFGGNI